MPNRSLIEEIRSASRLMVRELGFMNATLAATDYSPSAVHSLLEIENQSAMTAAQLVRCLGLEKSSVSRMLSRLLAEGELLEVQSGNDARVKQLKLTEKGVQTVSRINDYGAMRVIKALENLDDEQQQTVAHGLTAYARALERCHNLENTTPQKTIDIVTGYLPGMIGKIAEMHGTYYAKNYNFGHFFEGKVACGVAEFAGRLHEPCNQIWLAVNNGKIVGSVAIDGQDLGNNEGHLRWFILDDSCRGTGMGRKLLSEAMAFCDKRGFDAVQLWTFSGLNAARRLYESFGFELFKEWQGDQWGMTMTEQQFTRNSAGSR
ncbi:bifunctional helix-turn-helix transcriptional regulator/GNAT family N-acetyltransferase [Brenneria tiliae]|uniref:bifunctional helix-turn-helix transcriptional regulator/GNAT family N-acetyltransferase n=1 Tax=Brenneria tiliae TaxID=2914984 RepID=UPI002014F664|nr:bifunctional helix-turn-helix transcriptional regulator/GNAT family N-acetyltransferase [Brenneria tiliae]MCL2899919.1 bifunctional helix-turn-helix transcriptional regulator/GNAT family N-acetyltransferase [Brenneria tiliae]MCL2904594.1 bifunctional helix-turn-helix transcriptional regulator/GNAT family N-acetyltransferase [Brenneria tiliae]